MEAGIMKTKPKNQVGNWVSGNDFFDRKSELKRLQSLLDEGESLLLVAPRRVGKTSLLRETIRKLDERGKDYGLFIDIQNCSTPEEVIVELAAGTKQYRKLWSRTREVFASHLEKVTEKVDSLGIDRIRIGIKSGVSGDWQNKGDRLLAELAGAELPVVLCFDELPVMISRLLRDERNALSDEGRKRADQFLSWLRLSVGRHKGRIRFVICGSIGLEPVLRSVGLSHTITELRSFHLEPWDRETADRCLSALAESYELDLGQDARTQMLNRLGLCIPHHVQMFFGLVQDDLCHRKTQTVSVEDIDRVYDQHMLGSRGHAELADYEERLMRVIGKDFIPLAVDLLTEAAVNGMLTSESAVALAKDDSNKEKDPLMSLRTVLGVLEHDGYLRENDDGGRVYCSNLVRDWWKRRFAMGFIPAAKRHKGD